MLDPTLAYSYPYVSGKYAFITPTSGLLSQVTQYGKCHGLEKFPLLTTITSREMYQYPFSKDCS